MRSSFCFRALEYVNCSDFSFLGYHLAVVLKGLGRLVAWSSLKTILLCCKVTEPPIIMLGVTRRGKGPKGDLLWTCSVSFDS